MEKRIKKIFLINKNQESTSISKLQWDRLFYYEMQYIQLINYM